MSIEKPSPFCPDDCVFLGNVRPSSHEGCGHLEDIVVSPPKKGLTKTKPTKEVDVVGADSTHFYVENKMSNGNKSLFRILKEGIRIKTS